MILKEIRIKRDGKWYANDNEMFRKPILNIFATHLCRDEEGQFFIKLNDETFPVVVEDVPFLVVDAHIKDGAIVLVFHDQQEMVVDHEIPVHFKGDVPYVSYRWEKDTRLDRSAFWMISNFLVEKNGQIYLVPPGHLKN